MGLSDWKYRALILIYTTRLFINFVAILTHILVILKKQLAIVKALVESGALGYLRSDLIE